MQEQPRCVFFTLFTYNLMYTCHSNWAWWHRSVLSVLGSPGSEDGEFKVTLGYTVRPCFEKKDRNKQASKGGLCF